MSDNMRELLELAALAAGRECVWNHGRTNAYHAGSLFYMTGPNHRHNPWNPATSDEDSRRLQVALGIELAPSYFDKAWIAYRSGNVDGNSCVDHIKEPFDGYPCAAARLAILKVAAEIGRRIKEQSE